MAETAITSEELRRDGIARRIDHTELAAHAGRERIETLCDEARTHGFYSVCVNPVWAAVAAERLRGSAVRVCVVAGFPLGATPSEAKAKEADLAVRDGASEVDMVVHVGALRDGSDDLVREDIRRVVEAAGTARVKVILETCYLTDAHVARGCRLSREAGAAFVKTSTGFGPAGAFPAHLRLMRETVGSHLGVKASGGIRTFRDAWRMIEAGADRIGASRSVEIVREFERLREDPSSWREPLEPCADCPSGNVTAGKQPADVLAFHEARCAACEHRAARRAGSGG